MLHKDMPIAEVHVPYSFMYANATERAAATGFVSADLGKLARQLDNNSFWLLTDITPTWTAFGGGGGVSPAGSDGQLQVRLSGALSAVGSGTAGQVLKSQGAGQPPVFAADGSIPLFVDKGNSGTTAQVVNYSQGVHQRIAVTGAFTLSLSNLPASGVLGELLLELVNAGAFAITWPTINWVKPDGTTTTSIATYLAANTGRTALQTSGTDFVLLWTRDGGTTTYGKLI